MALDKDIQDDLEKEDTESAGQYDGYYWGWRDLDSRSNSRASKGDSNILLDRLVVVTRDPQWRAI